MKIYNEYNYGSYLLFRGIPVFIDSRCDLYTKEYTKWAAQNKAGYVYESKKSLRFSSHR